MKSNILTRGAQLVTFALCGSALVAACSSSSGGGASGGFGAATSSGGSGADTGSGGAGAGTGASPGSGGFGAGLIDAGNGQGGGGLDPDAACQSSVFRGEQIPLDIHIVMDKSGSMVNTRSGGVTVWEAVKQAIVGFVQAPESAGIGVGIQFFPQGGNQGCGSPPNCAPGCTNIFIACIGGNSGSSCEPGDYLPPAVTPQPLPGVSQQIIDALNAQQPGGGTPTRIGLETAVQATTTYAATVPGRKVIVVLATDGAPNDCNSTVDNVSDVARTAAAANPSVETFVIGIGRVQNLDTIARAGGTGQALVVEPATAAQDFLAAMNAIRGQALGCDFSIDSQGPNGEMIDFGRVNVLYTPDGAAAETVFNVDGPGSCDPALGGWYYDNPAAPTTISVCPTSCERLTAGSGTVSIQLGCATVPIPR